MSDIQDTQDMTVNHQLAYRPAQAAAMIGISVTKLHRLMEEGTLPARKIGAATIILHGDLEEFLSSLDERNKDKAEA